MRRGLVGLVMGGLAWAVLALPAYAAGGATVTLRCADAADDPVDLRACFADSRLEISREGTKTAYTAADLASLGAVSDGVLTLAMPHNFSVRARNSGEGLTLALTVTAPGGRVVHTAEAGRLGVVQFYHCGPSVDPQCREYNYSEPQ
ncbi:hypothetical protein [Roseospira goensis]|uniref:Uncharacterized protein n=1 Tax=Roseospira goensis TaxID=391922 RepID=A0A7W6RYK4_9PROT|nr:hypothetical protein [Roseospira goensis]MBB4285608.1 hypothetical protein [Roseospira goensis]